MIIPAEYIIAGFIALSGAIVALFKVLSAHGNQTEDKLSRVERLREEDNKEIKGLIGEVSGLKAERRGFEAGVERISSQVLQEIRSLKGREQ